MGEPYRRRQAHEAAHADRAAGAHAVPDGERRQFGLTALRKRFVRRAVFLANDEGFREAVADARRTWNDQEPRWPVHIGDPAGVIGLPLRLEDACEANTRRFYEAGARHHALRHSPPPDLDAIAEASAALDTHFWPPEMEARARWDRMVDDLSQRFWPPDAFPVPGLHIHPATGFVTACFYADPRSLKVAAHFDAPALRVGQTPDVGVFIPLYPGVTADDIRRAADRLAREAERAFALDLPEREVRRLRAEGASYREIADRLGMPRSTVQMILDAPA